MVFNRQLYKQKPSAWGPVSSVQASIFKNIERIGIDHELVASLLPFWERAGLIRDCISNKAAKEQTNTSWVNSDLYFDGSVSNVKFDNANGLFTPTTSFTFYTIITVNSYNQFDRLFDTKTNYYADSGWTVSFRDSQSFDFSCGGGNYYEVTATNMFTVGSKLHLCMSYDSIGKKCNVYINGVFKQQLSSIYWSSNSNTNDFAIGQYWSGGNNPEITLNFFSLFCGALSPQHILYFYDNPYYLLHQVTPVFYSVPGGGIPPTFNPLFLNAAQPTRVIQ